jgi:hypothetical protein
MERLTQIGFLPAGQWHLRDDRLDLELTRASEQKNVLYAIVCDDEALYVGKTTQTLRRRLNGYLRPGSTQATNVRNHRSIVELLRKGRDVYVFAWPDHGLHRYGDFTINMAAALEDSIIDRLCPPWNGQRDKRVIESPDERDPPDDSQEARLEAKAIEETPSAFDVEIGDTYFGNGFFNVPVRAESLFGADKSSLTIYCGAERQVIEAWINRRSNTNGTPRIMGGAALRGWFERNLTPRSSVVVRSLTPSEIALELKRP